MQSQLKEWQHPADEIQNSMADIYKLAKNKFSEFKHTVLRPELKARVGWVLRKGRLG